MQWLVRGEPSVPLGREWLTEVEARRAFSMRFTKRRTEYLLRRYAGKCAVAVTLGLPEDPITLGRIAVLNAPTGAPFVQVDGTRIAMDVSLTDRSGWAVCLVGADLSAVGVDLEIVEARSPGFVSDFLTPAEQALVAEAARSGEGDAAANLIWSAKEAALKVLRTGLRADTRTVQVALDPAELGVPAGQPGQSAEPAYGPDRATPAGPLGAGPLGAGALGTAGIREGEKGNADPGWHRMTVDTVLGRLPGWWRRDGLFLLTVVTGRTAQHAAPVESASDSSDSSEPSASVPSAPRMLPGSADLASAPVIETWRTRPLAD